jgi:hypothetical protein
METGFGVVSLSLFLLSMLTMFLIVRDVLPLMSSEEQNLLCNSWIGPVGFRTLRNRDRAIGNVWNEHVRSFPYSRKRAVFASLLIACAISVAC